MNTTFAATYDGEVFRPDQPLPWPPNTRVRLTVVVEPEQQLTGSFLQTAESLRLEGPTDWSERLDDYLYGPSDADG